MQRESCSLRRQARHGGTRSRHTWGVSMTVRESLFHLFSLQSSLRPQPSTAFRVPSASLQHAMTWVGRCVSTEVPL